VFKRLLGRSALAARMCARTVDVRRLFHSLALRAAILARRLARTNRMRALLGFLARHVFLLWMFGSIAEQQRVTVEDKGSGPRLSVLKDAQPRAQQ
jgi:hypothetical protein